MRDDGGDGSAARTLELVVVEKKKERNPSVDVGCRLRERAFEPPATCFLTGVWRATVLLGPTPAAINPLMALCPYAFQPLLAILVLSPFSPFALSLSLALSLSALFCTALRHPTTFIPTRMTSVTILLYFPSNPRHPFLFSLTVSSYIFFSFSLFLLSFGTDSPSFSS